MIASFRHKGLRRLFEDDNRSGLSAALVERLRNILFALDEATSVGAMNLPGFRLHPLKGDRVGFYSVTLSANWRVVFRFEAEAAHDVDLLDYH